MKATLLPSWHSIRRPLSWILFFTSLLSGSSLFCLYYSPRGIDFHAILFFAGIPLVMIFIPLCIIFLSFKIQLDETKLILFEFFIPVRILRYHDIIDVKYEKVSKSGQVCALTFVCRKGEYSYPIRLFSERKIQLLIDFLIKEIIDKDPSSNKMNTIENHPIPIADIDRLTKELNTKNTEKQEKILKNRNPYF